MTARRRPLSPCARLAAAIVAAAVAPGSARAEGVDPTAAPTIFIGPPRGPSPVARSDAGRTGRAGQLPAELTLLWKTQVHGGLDFPVVVGEGGTLVAASAAGPLITLDAGGKESSRTPLPAPAVQGPILTSAGDRVVLTASGEALSVRPTGEVRYRTQLPVRGKELRAAPVATPDGGVVVAAGLALLSFDAEGRAAGRGRLPEPAVGALLGLRSYVVATGESGRVYRWRPADEPRLVGQLGGTPTSSGALSGDTLVIVVDQSRLLTIDLLTGVIRSAVGSSSILEGPAAIGPSGGALVATSSGLLLAFGPDGRELERTALQGAAPPGSHVEGLGGFASSPPVIVGDDGRAAFVRLTGEVGLASRGSVRLAEQRVCFEPIGIAPDRDRIIVSCRDGTVAAYGAASSAASLAAPQAPVMAAAGLPPRRR